jgi:DNA-3-methyladenine glycosylase II
MHVAARAVVPKGRIASGVRARSQPATKRVIPTFAAAEKRLAASDHALGAVIAFVTGKIGPQRVRPSQSKPFEALARAIVYQGVSGPAAATVFARFKVSVGSPFVPKKVLEFLENAGSSAGLSKTKAGALKGLATWFVDNPKQAKALPTLPDCDAIATLTAIPGIGPWTVNVFLIFNLGRLDVIPSGDSGIRRGVQLVCGLKTAATPKQVMMRAARWKPYRSIASVYLWNAVKLKMAADDLK